MLKNGYTLKLNSTTENDLDKLFIQTYEQDDLETHGHDFFEFVYITDGTTYHTLNENSSALASGDYFIVDYGSIHSYTKSNNLKLINCLFLPEIIDDTLRGCISYEELMHGCLLRYHKLYSGKTLANQIFHDTEGRIRQILATMILEYKEKRVGYTEILRNRLIEIIIISMRNIVDININAINNDMAMDLISYLNSNYREHKLLSKFCSDYHYSPQYISRKFKQETSFTPSKYLQKIRIEKSCELLAGSNMAISAISEAVGYSDIKFFNTLFKKMIRMSPRDYRKLSKRL